MHIGNAITSILLADMFDKNNQRGGHPLRPDKGHADYSRSRKKGQRWLRTRSPNILNVGRSRRTGHQGS